MYIFSFLIDAALITHQIYISICRRRAKRPQNKLSKLACTSQSRRPQITYGKFISTPEYLHTLHCIYIRNGYAAIIKEKEKRSNVKFGPSQIFVDWGLIRVSIYSLVLIRVQVVVVLALMLVLLGPINEYMNKM